jgi:O-methyltransferase
MVAMVAVTDDVRYYKGKSTANMNIFAGFVKPRKWYLVVVVAAGLALVAWPKAGVQQLRTLTDQEKKCLPLVRASPSSKDSSLLVAVSPTNTRQCLIDQGASPYIDILSKLLVGIPLGGSGSDVNNLQPYDEEARSLGTDYPAFSYTMVGKLRLRNLRCAIDEVNRNGIKGSIVELGVWRGGVMMFASAMGKESGIQRDLYLLDAFQVIGAYTSGGVNRNEALANYLATSVDNVKKSFEYFDLGGPHVHYEKGLFQDTLPLWKDRDVPIAILRVDGNFYDSYQDAMYYLYEKVPVGGIVIFDDVYGNDSVMSFWLDFKKDQGLSEDLTRIDKGSAWFRKDKAVKLNWDYFREPQDVNKKS